MTTQVDLREASSGIAHKGGGSRRRAKLIAADIWGSSAYYPAEVLERDGARVFVTGTQMFENHMSENERWERPEGNVANLVGKLTSDALYEANGEDGPGLYADVEFYQSYVERINEIAGDIGLSVNASGLTEDAEMDGRYGPILVALLAAQSVDVVTKAGAGGKLVSILESDRQLAGRPIENEGEQSVTDLTKEDFEGFKTELLESITQLTTSITESITSAVGNIQEAQVVEPIGENGENDDEGDKPAEIDHAAVLEAMSTNHLPAIAAKAIVTSITEGATLEDAVKTQVDLREAFRQDDDSIGTVTYVREAGNTDSGLARAVKILG